MAVWVARVLWIVVAVFGGAAVEGAVANRSDAVRWVAGVGSWAVWGIVMLALAIPAVRTLTVVRAGSPLAVVASAGAALHGATATEVALLAIPALLACASIFTADTGREFVQASSYGDEERLPLRMPVAAGTAATITWMLWALAVIAGPLLLASHRWILGAVLVIFGFGGSLVLVPGWHRLSRRWLVLVPAGLVVHDPVVLGDTLMLRTDQVLRLGLAPHDTDAADLTGPASGYAIEVHATESVTTVFARTPKEPNGRAIHMTGFLISPSRPGAALRAAEARGLQVF